MLTTDRIAVTLLACALTPTHPAPGAEARFTEVTDAAGIDFRHGALADTLGNPMHGGGTVGDFNGDGWPDLFFVGGGDELDHLYINRADGTFVDEAAAWGLGGLYRGVAAAAADYDGDGDTDLFVTSLGPRGQTQTNGDHRLYRNNGDRSFTEVAEKAGLSATALDVFPNGYGAAWGDYDLDGDLDLWVGAWHLTPLGGVRGNRLFRNNGDGTFDNVTAEAGVADDRLFGFGAVFADLDGDRYPELLVAGDFGTSRYFANRGDGTFERRNPLPTPGQRVHNGMGTTVGDFDRDGRIDWFVTAIWPAWEGAGPPGNRLFLNRSRGPGDHRLTALPHSAGVDDGGWGWGVAALDFDHDGWLDVVHTNGWIHDCSAANECYENEPSYLFRNRGDGTFAEVASSIGLDHEQQGRGLMTLDFDRDGDLDVVILSYDDRALLYRNDLAGDDAHWLEVKLDTRDAPSLAPHGLGARVTIEAGSVQQTQLLHAGNNYLTRSEIIAHFGLGSARDVDRLRIEWPDGRVTELAGRPADDRIVVAVADRTDRAASSERSTLRLTAPSRCRRLEPLRGVQHGVSGGLTGRSRLIRKR